MLSRNQGSYQLSCGTRTGGTGSASHTENNNRDGSLGDGYRHPPRRNHWRPLHHRPRYGCGDWRHLYYWKQRETVSGCDSRSKEFPTRREWQPNKGNPTPPYHRGQCGNIRQRHYSRPHHYRQEQRCGSQRMGDTKPCSKHQEIQASEV